MVKFNSKSKESWKLIKASLVNSERQPELHFYCSLASPTNLLPAIAEIQLKVFQEGLVVIGNKDYRKVHKYIHAGIDDNRPHTSRLFIKPCGCSTSLSITN